MSLRKSTSLTAPRLAAARRNCQHSTGPRTPAGKERVKMNALKHGGEAAPENEAAVMRALGEDPVEYEALKRELRLTYGPGDPLWTQQLEDLARLYWRRRRLERIQTGLMRRALQGHAERRRGRAKALADATFDATQFNPLAADLGLPTDLCVRRRQLLSLLGVIRAQLGQRIFRARQKYLMETYYRGMVGWRPVQIAHLLHLFVERANYQEQEDAEGLQDLVKDSFGGEAGVEARYQELLRLLDEQIAAEEEEFEQQLAAQEEKEASERDACLAPEGETWERLLRQEAALDRSIDRKVRILLAMRKEYNRLRGQAASPAEEIPELSAEGNETLGLDQPSQTAGEGAAGEESKPAEQSENVYENKAPAAEGVRA